MRGTSINVTTSSPDVGAQRHPGPCPPPAWLQPDHVNAVVLVICRSMRRLQVAEARGRGLTDMEHPHQHHGRELDDLYRAAGKMTHDERLARLAELGEPIDDLALPEPPR